MDVVIYHNPACATSRNTLGMIRNAGIEPHVIDYLKCPPSRVLLEGLIARMGIAPRDLLREKGTQIRDLAKTIPGLTDVMLEPQVPKPDLVIFLQAETARLVERIKRRRRDYEAEISEALRAYGPSDAGYTYADKIIAIYNRNH